jgi:opacity protein-like surface antigen
MIHRIRIAAACAAIVPVAATAADTFYLTAAGGYSWAQTSKLEASHGDGFDFQTGSGQSEDHGAWRVGAGWFVLPRVALELAYADYGRQSFSVEGVPSPAFVPEVLSESRASERKVSAAVLDMVGHWPVHERFTLVGRVGAAYGLVKTTSRIEAPGGFPFGSGPQSASFDSRTRSWAFHAAGGVRCVDVLPTLDVEAMLEYLGPVGRSFSGDSLDTTGRSRQTTLWLGLVKRF